LGTSNSRKKIRFRGALEIIKGLNVREKDRMLKFTKKKTVFLGQHRLLKRRIARFSSLERGKKTTSPQTGRKKRGKKREPRTMTPAPETEKGKIIHEVWSASTFYEP